ncbi:hypothetical protein K502DRAFT_326260 [Neoconidiobolus thromboides FSU 785]|nr:hypothetical protein K502DRAFT_326260 [Neoconidiobolus thromboides FSU 785]
MNAAINTALLASRSGSLDIISKKKKSQDRKNTESNKQSNGTNKSNITKKGGSGRGKGHGIGSGQDRYTIDIGSISIGNINA